MDIGGHGEYDVKEIQDFQLNDGQQKWLVKWSGYEKETWEPLEHLGNASEALAKFQKGQWWPCKLKLLAIDGENVTILRIWNLWIH